MKFTHSYSQMLLFLLLVFSPVICSAAENRINAGFAPGAHSLFPDAAAVERFGSALADALDVSVSVRLFEDIHSLPQWLDRFRAIDLSLIPRKDLQMQPPGRLFPLLMTDTDEVFVLRQGIGSARREQIATAIREVVSEEKRRPPRRKQNENPSQKIETLQRDDSILNSSHGPAAPLSEAYSEREDALRQEAVKQARGGHLEDSLQSLQQLYNRNPANRKVAYDYLTVLGWAERDAEVVILADSMELDEAPLHVVDVVAKALRNHKWFEASALLYAEAMQRWPDHLPFALGRLMALADAGEVEASRSLVRQLRIRHPERRDVLSACVYAAERAGDHLTALDLHQRLLGLNPADPDALRGRIRALRLLGASHLALHYAEKSPGLLQEAELQRLHNDAAAHQVRWGSYSPEAEETRFLETDQALERISANLRRLHAADNAPPALVRQGRIDRMVALRNRVCMPEVVTLYQSLQREYELLPAYALKAAADAYLYLEQPEAAHDIYQQVLRLEPDDFETRLALFYADVELEEFDRAITRIDRLFAEAQAEKDADRQRLTVELTAALARVFAGDLPEAQNRIETLHGHAPLNPDLKRELGGVYAARGWPRKAESTLEKGLLNNPDHRGLQIARAHNHFDLRQYGTAQAAAEDLYERFPEDKHVQRLARRSSLHDLRELQVEAGYSDSSESDYDGNELRLGSTLYSAPLKEHYRLFAGILWSRGDFSEGRGLYRRYRSGVEYRGRHLEGSAEINYTAAGADGVGVAAAGLLHQDDQRSWPFAVEIRSSATPTRALRNGIDADAIRFGYVHREHERRRWSLGAGLMDFSDGNLRTHLRADLRQRLVTRPHYHLDGVVDLYASLNKKSDVPYYSPQQDASASVTLDNTWLLWRRYQRAFRHRFTLTLGGYQQQGYGVGPLLGVRYEHMWQADGRFDLVYGIGWHRRIYDGDPENGVDGNLAVRWRF